MNNIIEHETGQEIVNSQQPTQMISQADRLIELAIVNKATPEYLDKLLDLKIRYDKEEARKAYYAALALFKANPPRVVKDMLNKQYDSSYTSIGNMVNSVNEFLGAVGLSANWEYPTPSNQNEVAVTCVLSHKDGHKESVTLTGPVDVSGAKNPIQGRKSGRTYLKLETFEAITGMASVNANQDDDGNGAGNMTPKPQKAKAPQIKPLSSEIFEKNMQTWEKFIAGGGTYQEILIKLTSSKYTLTAEQVNRIKNIGVDVKIGEIVDPEWVKQFEGEQAE